MDRLKGLRTYLIQLAEFNLAMAFISTSGALGRYIQLSPEATILMRAALSLVILAIWIKLKGIPFRILHPSHRKTLFLGGLFFGLHWVTYFYALQLSSVAVGMLSVFTYPVMTSLLEPLVLGTSFKKIHLWLGMLILLGVYFLVPNFTLESKTTIAVGMGLLSALLYSFRNLLMKKRVHEYDGSVLMGYQMLVITVLLSPFLLTISPEAITSQWVPLVSLALITTCLGHTLFLMSFRHFSVTAASIMSSIQPLYGILFGWWFLSEIPDWRTMIGGGCILLAVVTESLLAKKEKSNGN